MANQLIEATLSKARQKWYQPMAVVVFDEPGHARCLPLS